MSVVKPRRIAIFFRQAPEWVLSVESPGLVVDVGGHKVMHSYTDVIGASVLRGLFWSALHLRTPDGETFLRGLGHSECAKLSQELTSRIGAAVNAALNDLQGPAILLARHLDGFFAAPKYLAQYDLQKWLAAIQNLPHPELAKLRRLLAHPLLNTSSISSGIVPAVSKLQDVLAGSKQGLIDRNAAFVRKELAAHSAFFDTVESRPLTEEQRKAAVVMEDRNLLIAAAGSGKSSTVVAKIGYALTTGYCQPEGILAVVFNRNAREELEARLAKRLPGKGERVATRTFHKLGKDIIAAVEGKQPTPAPWAEDAGSGAKFIDSLIEELSQDPEFLTHWVLFRSVCSRPNKELSQFKDRQDYDRYLREVGEEREGRRGILTLNGELVKSMEELAIANWLYLNGVDYQYERSYEFDTADHQHRQYFPDFYYPEVGVYHEHFALNEQGRPPPFFEGDYAAGVIWKRALHAEKGTALIETTSAMYRRGDMFSVLRKELERRGVTFRPRPAAEILARLNQKQTQYASFLRTFITHMKSNGYTLGQLTARMGDQRDLWRAKAFLNVFAPVMRRYQEKLVEAGFIDFEDMVRRAADYVASGKFHHPYLLILVDEFQDISQAGAALVKAMLAQSPACKLFAVGDDWQSINRFAGADIDLMARFEPHFGSSAINYLSQTFRSNQGITDVAATFVQANPTQYRKTVRSTDATAKSVIQITEYRRDEDVEGLLISCLNELASTVTTPGRVASVFILARYNHLKPGNLAWLRKQFQGRLSIEFKSAHRSKGLEADFVIVLGLNSGAYSFPSQIEDDPLLEMVMPVKENYAFAEERRLFYVALTRARHKVVLFTRKSRISRFIPELLAPAFREKVRYGEAIHASAKACPACGSGVLREKFGKFRWFLGCSTFPECRHTEKIHRDHNR